MLAHNTRYCAAISTLVESARHGTETSRSNALNQVIGTVHAAAIVNTVVLGGGFFYSSLRAPGTRVLAPMRAFRRRASG